MDKHQMIAVCRAAGVTDDEMRDDPQHGLLLSASGVRKLAATGPDNAAKRRLRS